MAMVARDGRNGGRATSTKTLSDLLGHNIVCRACFTQRDDDTTLKRCSECKTVYYCSGDCQRKNWKLHKSQCKAYTAMRESIKKRVETPIYNIEQSLLPDGVSPVELHRRLENWTKAHNILLQWVSFQALYKPEDDDYILTHALIITISPRPDHGNSHLKYFRIVKAATAKIQDLRELANDLDTGSLNQIFDFLEQRRKGQTSHDTIIAPTIIDCPPLPYTFRHEEIKSLPRQDLLDPEWQETLFNYVEDGVSLES